MKKMVIGLAMLACTMFLLSACVKPKSRIENAQPSETSPGNILVSLPTVTPGATTAVTAQGSTGTETKATDNSGVEVVAESNEVVPIPKDLLDDLNDSLDDLQKGFDGLEDVSEDDINID